MTFNTGNKIGSTDARDRSDNTENMDYLENSTTELTHPDRLGTVRKTRHGMEAEHDAQIAAHESEHDAQMRVFESGFDAQILNMGFTRVGTFATGATITNPRQTLLWDIADDGDGQEYGWSGAFPKVVPATSTPASTGGISVSAWISRFDPELRIQVREALRRSYAEAGYNLVAGSFEVGGALVNANDVLLYEASGKVFSGPAGPVAAGSTPATSGGIGAGAWVDRTDLTLRVDLAASGGVNLVSGAISQEDLVLQSITKIPSYDNSNVVQAWRDSVATYGYVYFSNHSKNQMVYTVPSTAANASFLANSKVIIDKNVTLRFDNDLYSLFKSLQYEGEGAFEFTNLNFKATGGEVDYLAKQAILNRNPVSMKRVEWPDCKVYFINGDTFTAGQINDSSDSAITFSLAENLTTGLFAPIAVGEHISAHIRMEHQTASEVGIVLRCAGGWMMIYGAPGATQWSYRQKPIGGQVAEGTPFPLPGGLLSYAPGKATVGVSLQGKNLAQITMNGVGIRLPFATGDVGDVYEIGFVALTSASGGSARVTGLCSYTSDNGVHGKPPLNILIHGDSTAEDFISSFSSYIPQLMDGANGHRSCSIVNKAVAGQTMRQQLDLLKAQGTGDAYIVIMVAGTNEGQLNKNGDYMAALIDEFVLYCYGIGRIPVWVEPWMWYSQSFIGGAGQQSGNYDGVAELREAGKRQMMKYGNNAICVTTTHQLPAPYPEYFNTQYDPLLRDDIHQSQLGYRLYAEIICSAIIDWWSRVDYTPRAVPQWWAGAGVTVQTPSSASKSGINVKLAVTSFANGNAVLTLPRWCRPSVSKNIPVPFTDDGVSFGMAMATINASNGEISIRGATTTSPTFYIDAYW